MPDLTNMEYRDENRQRRYPLADGANVTSDQGVQLPDDAFLDALVYPFGYDIVYVSKVDTLSGTVELSTGTTKFAAAVIDPATDILEFYDIYGRRIGTMIYGPGLVNAPGTLTFNADATPLCAASVFQQMQESVNGFVLPDGTVVSGEVTFAGIDGLRCVTYVDSDGVKVLRFDAVGVPDVPDCVDLPDPIRCIDVSQGVNSNLTISRTDNRILIGHRTSLADVCTNKDRLPADDGTLPLNPPCDPCWCVTGGELGPCNPICPTGPDCTGATGPGPAGPCPDDPQDYYISVVDDLMTLTPDPGVAREPVGYTNMSLRIQQNVQEQHAKRLAARAAQGVKLALRGVSP
jgi:hypothetical protein